MEGLAATDEHGFAAYVCALDNRELERVADAEGVLRCPVCGHRTDEPGGGVLGDGFDIRHRQYGLRGDLHAMNAMRVLLTAVPTPGTAAETRTAFVDALRSVADVDIDHETEQKVHRPHLDHGGMSGGWVHVEWWRNRGVPLLVDRATSRRPTPPPATSTAPPRARRSARSRLADVAIWLVLLAIPAALIGGGGWLLYQRAVGTRVDATVLECSSSGLIVSGGSTYRTDCIARWTIDGRVEVGGFNGGNGASDVGRTVEATVRDGVAYSRSLTLPIILIVLGLPFLILPVNAVRRRARRPEPHQHRTARAPAADAPPT